MAKRVLSTRLPVAWWIQELFRNLRCMYLVELSITRQRDKERSYFLPLCVHALRSLIANHNATCK
jgi:hypothetical protein